MAQLATDAIETMSKFSPSFRTAAGWVCVLGLAHVFFLSDWANLAMQGYSLHAGRTVPKLEKPGEMYVFELIALFCGLAGLKTFDRLKGVATQ